MKALILSAGLGTRLAPITTTIPKALAPVNGIPIIFYVLALLKQHGIREFVLNLHHHGEKIPELLGDGSKLGISIEYSREPVILGTGGGIKKMLSLVKDEEDVLIANGDVIADFDISRLIAQHKKNKPYATFALYKHPDAKKYGLLSYKGATGRSPLLSILNKPTPPADAEQAMFASFHIVNRVRLEQLLSSFDNNKMFCIMNDVYIPHIQKQTNDFDAFIVDGFWRACDSLEDIREVEALLNGTQKKLSYQCILEKFA